MKLKFKDGTIIEVTDTKGLSKEEIVAEAKKVYKDFKDSQVKDGTLSQIEKEIKEAKQKWDNAYNEWTELSKIIAPFYLPEMKREETIEDYLKRVLPNVKEENRDIVKENFPKYIEAKDKVRTYRIEYDKLKEELEEAKNIGVKDEEVKQMNNDFKDSQKSVKDEIDAEFVAEVNKEIGGRPFEFTEEEDGFADVLYVELDNTGKLVAGTATNAGIVADYGIPYDIDVSLDENLNKLYETIIETRNNEASIQDEEEVIEEEIEEV